MSDRRYIPEGIRRQLRQEACFGCCYCGDPILDYHHIIPWSERKHNEPDHMIALCPTHHRMAGKMSRSKQYKIKHEPINAKQGAIKGLLVSEKLQTEFLMGSNLYVNTPVIFSYFELPIIKYRIAGGQNLISVYIPKNDYWPELLVEDNDMIVETSDAWDIVFRSNYLKFTKASFGQFFEIDFRSEVVKIAGRIEIGGNYFEFDAQKTNLDGAYISGCRFENCGAGIAYGDGIHRILVPNYAMQNPGPIMHKFRS